LLNAVIGWLVLRQELFAANEMLKRIRRHAMKSGISFIVSALLSTTMAVALANQVAPAQGTNPSQLPPSPLVHSDGTVTFNLFAPNASSVILDGDYPLVGDFHGGRKPTPLTRDSHGEWSVTVGPLKADIYNYAFKVDGIRILDPQNVHLSRSSAANRITNWVIVPGPASANYQINDVPHGQVSEVWYPSPSLKGTRRIVVYTPPGYDAGTSRYPVFYLYHGGGEDEFAWSVLGRAPQILDNLIAQGKTLPMIVVMPSWNVNENFSPSDANTLRIPNSGPPKRDLPDSMSYAESVVRDLIPFVDKTYRTIADRDHRAVAGSSAGGTQALLTGFQHVDAFSWIGLLSPALARVPGAEIKIPMPPDADTRRGPDLGVSIDSIKFEEYFPMLGPNLNQQLHLLYFSVGGSEGLLEEEKAGRKVFDEKGVKYTWVERPGYGHEWAFWRQDLEDFSALLFKPEK
jgi:enterochelin esterase-like enzyme